MYLDNEVLNSFRARAENAGMGYQIKQQAQALDEATLRRVLREELQSSGR